METTHGDLIIADAGPLIILSRIGRLDLMKQVLGGATVTQFVRDELLCGGQFTGQSDIESALRDWLKVAVVNRQDRVLSSLRLSALHHLPTMLRSWCSGFEC